MDDFEDPGPEELPPVDSYEDYIDPEPELPKSNVIPLYEDVVKKVEPEFPEDPTDGYRPQPIDPNKPPPPQPTVLTIHDTSYDPAGYLFSEGNKYVVTGPQASGKSWLALAIACEFMRAERAIWWMDPDGMNESRVVARLRDPLRVSDAQMATYFFYAQARDHIPLKALSEALSGWAEADPPALVVWDSWGPSLSHLGLDGNSADDVNVWWQTCIEPIAAAAPECIHVMLDHVPKNQSELQVKGVYGSQRKLSAPDAALTMHTGEVPGTFFINVAKDRDGSWQDWSRDGLNMTIEDGCYLMHNRSADEKESDEHEKLLASAAAALHQLTHGKSPVSKKAWRSEFQGRDSDKTRAMTTLVELGVAVEGDTRNGQTRFRWDKPYDAAEAPAPEAPEPEAPVIPVAPKEDEFEFPF